MLKTLYKDQLKRVRIMGIPYLVPTVELTRKTRFNTSLFCCSLKVAVEIISFYGETANRLSGNRS